MTLSTATQTQTQTQTLTNLKMASTITQWSSAFFLYSKSLWTTKTTGTVTQYEHCNL